MTKKDFICACVSHDANPLLQSVLEIFCSEWAARPEGVYLNQEKYQALKEKIGEPSLVLILALLDNLDVVGHMGSLESSSYLTHKGLVLRNSLQDVP